MSGQSRGEGVFSTFDHHRAPGRFTLLHDLGVVPPCTSAVHDERAPRRVRSRCPTCPTPRSASPWSPPRSPQCPSQSRRPTSTSCGSALLDAGARGRGRELRAAVDTPEPGLPIVDDLGGGLRLTPRLFRSRRRGSPVRGPGVSHVGVAASRRGFSPRRPPLRAPRHRVEYSRVASISSMVPSPSTSTPVAVELLDHVEVPSCVGVDAVVVELWMMSHAVAVHVDRRHS